MNNISSNTIDIAVGGMSCASCSGAVEKALLATPGVIHATVNLATEKARVELSSPESLGAAVAAVEKAGYEARPILDTPQSPQIAAGATAQKQVDKEGQMVLWGALLTLPLVLPMVGMLFGKHYMLPGWVQLLLASPVQFWLGARFYRGALKAIQNRTGNMDLLVAIGTSAAFGLSVYMVGEGNPHLYFEASAAVITLVMLGKWLEARAKRQTTAAIAALQALRPDTATVLEHGQEKVLPIASVTVGMHVVVKPGERIALDGRVLEGESRVDEALITGESQAVEKSPGSKVTGGAVNLDGRLLIEVSAVGAETTLAKIIRLVEDAQAAKPDIQAAVANNGELQPRGGAMPLHHIQRAAVSQRQLPRLLQHCLAKPGNIVLGGDALRHLDQALVMKQGNLGGLIHGCCVRGLGFGVALAGR